MYAIAIKFGIPGLEIGIGIKKTDPGFNPGGKIDRDPGIVSPKVCMSWWLTNGRYSEIYLYVHIVYLYN